jgi:AraC family transcriptional regulator, regulatory protein of adaptative response / methylated-DNA-[protein]-cysteine methyltransferase
MSRMNKPTAACIDGRDFTRIARAIDFIDANFRAQPRLAGIAAAAHLSPFHFNRLFRRWAGVTPRQYLAFVTARAARGALLGSRSVLDAALAVGLSGPGRLHDLMVTLEALTPGELRARGAGVELRAGFAETPFGEALIAATPRGLSHLSFVEPGGETAALAALARQWPEAQLVRDTAAAQQMAQRIWGGGSARTALRLVVKGTNFQLKVWHALLELAPGTPTTYGMVARATGSPSAARAVGAAVGANPVAWLIPCHNVLRADGDLGGYHWGAPRKRAMLAWQELGRPGPRPVSAAGLRQAT